MTEADLCKYVKTQLGISWIDVEAENKDIKVLIGMALDKVAPYYEGHRFLQTSGTVIDLTDYEPLAIEKVYNVREEQLISLQDYCFGGSGVILYDSSILNRLITYTSFKTLWNEIKNQKGINYKLIGNTLYLDGYQGTVLIDMLVKPKVLADIDDTSMYHSWVKEYVLALTKEMVGRIRGKFTVEGSPYALDSASLLSEAQQEKSNLEAQLMGEIFVV